MFVFLSFDS